MGKKGFAPLPIGGVERNGRRLRDSEKPKFDTPLQEWLRLQGLSHYAFAKMVGATPRMVMLWATCRSLPSLPYAYKIEMTSKGGVPVASWLGTELGKMMWRRVNTSKKGQRGETE